MHFTVARGAPLGQGCRGCNIPSVVGDFHFSLQNPKFSCAPLEKKAMLYPFPHNISIPYQTPILATLLKSWLLRGIPDRYEQNRLWQ